ncbi:MAG: laccase [Linnemannia gamsii]|nr:MAG: laccase [Linnemannia gamsii]
MELYTGAILLKVANPLRRAYLLEFMTPIYNLRISQSTIAPDGFQRSAIVANGLFPGPLLSAIKGRQFQIKVMNEAAIPITIHWHGLLQNVGENWVDGTLGVTQCEILPLHSYLYTFQANQAGTFSYRAHAPGHHVDTLAGSVVVYDINDPHGDRYDVDTSDTIINLSDYYHSDTATLMQSYLNGETKSYIPSPDSVLINGKGRYAGGPDVPLDVTNVRQGMRLRFRVANIGTAAALQFSIDAHQLTVIEVDGTSVEPYVVTRLRVDVGQRYSVVVNANQPINNYWMRAEMDSTCFENVNQPLHFAILRYMGALPRDPLPPAALTGIMDFNQIAVHPLTNSPEPGSALPENVDVEITLDVTYKADSFRWFVNDITWRPDDEPTLLQVLNGVDILSSPTKMIIPVPQGSSVKITINNNDQCPKPFYLHGHKFHVISDNGSPSNLVNPIIRDTVTVAGNGNVVLRFQTGNPGVWALHSQNEWHRQAGLLAQLAYSQDDISEAVHPNAEWKQLCPLAQSTKAF